MENPAGKLGREVCEWKGRSRHHAKGVGSFADKIVEHVEKHPTTSGER